jgi:hypothetical protein
MLAHGFTVETLGRLVLNGHATAAPGIMYAGNRPIEVTRYRPFRSSSGSRAKFTAIRRASSRVSTLAWRAVSAGERSRVGPAQ